MNKKSLLLLLALFSASLINQANNTIRPDSNEEHDIYFRKFYCNTEHRKKITELPEHLITTCHKMNIHPQDINVFQEDTDPGYASHTIGTNIMLTKGFDELDQETQIWYFAHELSHVNHHDTERFWKLNDNLVDFQIASTIITALVLIGQIGLHHITISTFLGTLACYGISNIIALYAYYLCSQAFESRANDEATRATGADAVIAYLNESRWLRDHAQNANIRSRLLTYQEWLGFCHHGSYELQINRIKKIKHEMEQSN